MHRWCEEIWKLQQKNPFSFSQSKHKIVIRRVPGVIVFGSLVHKIVIRRGLGVIVFGYLVNNNAAPCHSPLFKKVEEGERLGASGKDKKLIIR